MKKNWVLSGFGDEISPSLEMQLEVMRNNGIYHLEIRTVNEKNILDLTNEELVNVKETIKEYGFSVSSIGSPIGKVHISEDFGEHLESFKRALYVANQLDAKYIRIFSFIMKPSETKKYREEVIDRLTMFAKLAEQSNMILLHENEKDIYGDTAERCLDIMESVDSPALRSTFDPANFVQVQEEPFPKAYQLLKDWVEYVHIKDATYSDRKVQPAGKGDANFKSFLTQLEKNGFEGFFSFEPHLTSDSGPGGGEGKFKLAVDSFKELVKNLEGVTIE